MADRSAVLTEPDTARILELRRRFPTDRVVDQTLSRKMLRRPNGPYRPQTLQAVTDKLMQFLKRRITEPFQLRDLHVLAGGSSKEQIAFRVVTADPSGRPASRDMVLRLQPAESFVETNRLREFQAIKSVSADLPVPEVFWVDAEGDELGQPGLIYEFVGGVSKPPADGPYRIRQGFGPSYRALLGPQFAAHSAALARHDWSHSDMSAFDAPAAGTTDGVIASLNWWQRVWEEDCSDRYPLVSLASRWLRENAPPIDVVSIVHGDLRGGNFLFDPGTGQITAILDWEMAHLGDRHEDLAFFLSPHFVETDNDGTRYAGGLLPADDFIRSYEALSGLPVDPERLVYYHVFTHWRSAINSIATAARCVEGAKTPQDTRVAWVANLGPLLLDTLRTALAARL